METLLHNPLLPRAPSLSAEVEEGNTEYKFKLTGLNSDTLTHRTTQLNWRLNEGGGEAFYKIGVEDNGNPLGISEEEMAESVVNLEQMGREVGCSVKVNRLMRGIQGIIAEVVMRRRHRLTVSPEQVNNLIFVFLVDLESTYSHT